MHVSRPSILLAISLALSPFAPAQVTVTVNGSAKHQVIDGFGTCLSGTEAQGSTWQSLYYDDLGASVLRVDLTPVFVSPYSDHAVYSPGWADPGPDGNYVRTYTGPADYGRSWSGLNAPIAVMGPNIDANVAKLTFSGGGAKTAAAAAQAGHQRKSQLGDFKLFGSLWSPAPWLKVSSGNAIGATFFGGPAANTAWPFIWLGNYAGGRLDTSDVPLAVFNDGTGPTSALTQFARSVAAYLRGFQKSSGVSFYAISIQNELNFEEFYNSCTYPLTSQYVAALKRVRAELNKYPDLKNIRLEGPEDLLSGDAYGLWQYGSTGSGEVDKNLHYLQAIAADPAALAALSFCSIHGYASDGVTSSGADAMQWKRWVYGWTTSPAPGIPANVQGILRLQKRSWMTETSGEDPAWLSPTTGFPGNGAWSIALKIQQALTSGLESAWCYWQFTDGNPVGASTLTDLSALSSSGKYVALKHFAKFIRPNSYRVSATVGGASGITASAFLSANGRTETVVLVNANAGPTQVALTLGSAPAGLTGLNAWTSSASALFQASTVPLNGTSATVTVPGYGVLTLNGTAP